MVSSRRFVLVHKTADRKWTIGALANHVWSIAGDSDRDDVSLTNIQPFFTRNLQDGWSLSFTSETSYNWKGSSGNEWTVPVGGTVAKVVRFGHIPSFRAGRLRQRRTARVVKDGRHVSRHVAFPKYAACVCKRRLHAA